ncbi:MAG: anti-sigma factor [Gammaproteobacteria bacterium]|nr:anti-sigma factor [Gammaproteobacteria bacterium]
MDCNELNVTLNAYVDGELDALTTARIESHLQSCASCQRRLREQMDVRAAIKTATPYFKAPANLRNRIHAELHKEAKTRWLDYLNTWRWPSMGAALSSVVLFGASLVLVLSMPSADELVAREVVSGHVRSLMAEHLTDIRSTDQHTVKPWFIGQLDFSPPVHDLATQGFALAGGRLDYVNNRQVAALVYHYRKHVINLFIWPAGKETTSNPNEREWQGYAAYEWTQAGMQFWAVSDINTTDLRQFARLLRFSAIAPPPQ